MVSSNYSISMLDILFPVDAAHARRRMMLPCRPSDSCADRCRIYCSGTGRGEFAEAPTTQLHKMCKTAVTVPRQYSTGFTLVELLVVVAIIALLSTFVAPRLFRQVEKSEAQLAKAQVDALQKALDAYRIDTGRYPSSAQGLAALSVQPADEPRWAGPYLQKAAPPDPWGRGYQYRSPGEHGRDYELQSLGKDGAAGGSGDAADIRSW